MWTQRRQRGDFTAFSAEMAARIRLSALYLPAIDGKAFLILAEIVERTMALPRK
jgi:hypothetical protein